jgi:hypothetical protein
LQQLALYEDRVTTQIPTSISSTGLEPPTLLYSDTIDELVKNVRKATKNMAQFRKKLVTVQDRVRYNSLKQENLKKFTNVSIDLFDQTIKRYEAEKQNKNTNVKKQFTKYERHIAFTLVSIVIVSFSGYIATEYYKKDKANDYYRETQLYHDHYYTIYGQLSDENRVKFENYLKKRIKKPQNPSFEISILEHKEVLRYGKQLLETQSTNPAP